MDSVCRYILEHDETKARSLPIDKMIGTIESCDAHAFHIIFDKAYGESARNNDKTSEIIYGILYRSCAFSVESSSLSLPHKTLSGKQTPDNNSINFTDCELAIMKIIGDTVKNKSLKARLYNIIYANNLSESKLSVLCVNLYCDLVNNLVSGCTARADLRNCISIMDKALEIAWFTTKKNSRPDYVIETFNKIYNRVKVSEPIGYFIRLVSLARKFSLIRSNELATALEACACLESQEKYTYAVLDAIKIAADLHHNDSVARERCLYKCAKYSMVISNEVKGSGAKAYWITRAIKFLDQVKGKKEEQAALKKELAALQASSLHENFPIHVDVPLGDMPEKISRIFKNLPRFEALKKFALLNRSIDPEKLQKIGVEIAEKSTISKIMPITYFDREGRQVSLSTNNREEHANDKLWENHYSLMYDGFSRTRIVYGKIDPARKTIQQNHKMSWLDFMPIVTLSPFVPPSHSKIFAVGFEKLFEADFISAAFILIPQVENSLRHILRVNDKYQSRMSDDMTEEDHSIKGIYSHFSASLDEILTPELSSEVERIFNRKPGPALRHEVAHGKLTDDDCIDSDTYYALWLIYHVVVLFLLPQWDELYADSSNIVI